MWCELIHDTSITTLYLQPFTHLQLFFEGLHYIKLKHVHTVEVDGSREVSPGGYGFRGRDTNARAIHHNQLLDKLVSELPALIGLHFVSKDCIGFNSEELVKALSKAPMLSSLACILRWGLLL